LKEVIVAGKEPGNWKLSNRTETKEGGEDDTLVGK